MAEAEFPSNSQNQVPPNAPQPASKKPAKKVERITTGEVIQRKTPIGTRLKRNLFSGNLRGAVTAAAISVLIPAIRDMAADGTREIMERVIYGEERSKYRSRVSGSSAYSPYGSQYRPSITAPPSPGLWKPANTAPAREVSPLSRATHDFGEILFESRGEAEQVLDTLNEIVKSYDTASVFDLYEMVGIKSNYPDHKYGWTNLRGSSVQHSRGSYLLNLPRPEPLD